MRTLVDFGLNEAYERVKKLGDRLNEIGLMTDWTAFRPILGGMYANKSERSGRPNGVQMQSKSGITPVNGNLILARKR